MGYGYDGNPILTFGPQFAMLTPCHRRFLPNSLPSTLALPKPRSATRAARPSRPSRPAAKRGKEAVQTAKRQIQLISVSACGEETMSTESTRSESDAEKIWPPPPNLPPPNISQPDRATSFRSMMATISLVCSAYGVLLFQLLWWVSSLHGTTRHFFDFIHPIDWTSPLMGTAGFILGVIYRRYWQGKTAVCLQLLSFAYCVFDVMIH